MKTIPLIDGSDEAVPEVYSKVLEHEVARFLCVATYLCDEDELYMRYLTELSGDGRRLVRRLTERLLKTIERDNRDN